MYVYYVEYADRNLATLAKTLDTAFTRRAGTSGSEALVCRTVCVGNKGWICCFRFSTCTGVLMILESLGRYIDAHTALYVRVSTPPEFQYY